ncbi:MAG: alternative ribosome rescue aminoacyl-tRNA hydrolase ArfB [Anaerolineae bacterium]
MDTTQNPEITDAIFVTETLSIPLAELEFRYSRSSGPGGQHASRADTRVELRFDVARSPSLDEDQRQRVMARLATRIDSAGVLHLTSQRFRSQRRNRQEVMERFQVLLARALARPRRRRLTRPPLRAKEQRLAEKRRRSEVKRLRQKVPPEAD